MCLAYILRELQYLNEVDDKQQLSRRIESILQQAINERNEHPVGTKQFFNMKQCINNQCKHELEDYQERCPYCGRSQKSFERVIPQHVSELQGQVKLNEESLRKRHGCVTTWLCLSIFVGIVTSVISFFPKEFWGSRFPDAAVPMSIVTGCLCVIDIVAIAMMLAWKKIGFFLYCVIGIVSCIITLQMGNVQFAIYGFVGIIVYYLVLQINKEGKSYWENME